MAERFTADLLFILCVLLVAALLGFLIGYLLERGRCRKRIAILDEEIEGLKAKISRLEEEKTALDAKLKAAEDEKITLDAKIKGLEEEKTKLRDDTRRMDDEIASLKLTIDRLEKEAMALRESQAGALKAAGVQGIAATPVAAMTHEEKVTHEEFKPDDLEVVIGIGPKIAGMLINRGITTWKALADTPVSYLREILDKDGGERYRIHNPGSWPQQARLLDEGRLDEFRRLREKLLAENR